MNSELIVLYALMTFSCAAAIGVLLTKNVFYGALMLILCLVSVAGIYLMLQAEFLAVTQIIIYAGGVLVLILFGIMLSVKLSGKGREVLHHNIVGGFLVTGSILASLIYLLSSLNRTPAQRPEMTHPMNEIGGVLFSFYSAPFEVCGFLLLISLVAAAIVATYRKNTR